MSCRRQRRGFSLIELLLVVAIMSVAAMTAVTTFRAWRQQDRSRSTMRYLVAVANEARSTALMFGSSSGTTRITNTAARPCPAEFFDGAGQFRSGLLFDLNPAPATPQVDSRGQSVTFVSRVNRNALPVGGQATYTVECQTVNIVFKSRGNLVLTAGGTTPAPEDGLLVLQHDARGFLRDVGGPVAAIGLETIGAHPRRGRIVLLGSGLSCIAETTEGVPTECRG